MLKQIANWRNLKDLGQLDEDELDDADFRPKDRAWSALVCLFEERKARENLTLEQLGNRIGKSRAEVHRWISSPYKLSFRGFGLLAEGLDADIEINLQPRCTVTRCANVAHPSEMARSWIELESTVFSTGGKRKVAAGEYEAA
jgi:hypothetical protein